MRKIAILNFVSVIIELVRELVTSNMLCQRQRRLTSITMLKSPPFKIKNAPPPPQLPSPIDYRCKNKK